MIVRATRWLIHRYGHPIGCVVIVLSSILAGGFAGLLVGADRPWPYDVLERRLVSDHVQIGDVDALAMQRRIDYHEEDCWRQYDRRVVSRVQSGARAGMVFRPMPVIEQKLPVDLSGKWQTWSVTLPDDFPCGSAYLVESVTAACTRFQRLFRPLRKPDIITPFEVTGCDKPPG